MTLPDPLPDRCADFIRALDCAREAEEKYRTNAGDRYDPCGNTAALCAQDRKDAAENLRHALRAFLETE